MAGLSVRLFGGLEASDKNGAVIAFPTRKTALLFAYLSLRSGKTDPRARLASMLWSDRGEEQARGSLRQSLFAIRRVVDAGSAGGLETDKDFVRLSAAAVDVDVHRAEKILHTDERVNLNGLMTLYQGALLEGWDGEDAVFDDWLHSERAQRERNVLLAMRRLVALEMEAGETGRALAVAERICAIDPLCEETHRQAMQIYMNSGNRNEALRLFERLRDRLDNDLGVEPEAATSAIAAVLKRPMREQPRPEPPSITNTRETGVETALKPALSVFGGPSTERRYVAVLAVDVDVTLPAIDVEERHEILGGILSNAARIVQDYGGIVERRSGYRLVAIFGALKAYSDDCERAVRAALDLQTSCPETANLKVGISNGAVYAEASTEAAGLPIVSGQTIDLAESLAQRSEAGGLYLSAAARDSLGARVEVDMQEREPECGEPAWRLKSFNPDIQTSFVGRSAELTQLDAALDDCLAHSRGRIIHIRGEPGIGKTRLAEEARRRAVARGFASHRAYVLDFGGRIKRDPVRAMLRSIAGLAETDTAPDRESRDAQALTSGRRDEDAALIYSLLDLPPPAKLRSILDAMNNEMRENLIQQMAARLVTEASKDRPLFLLVEDLHWIESEALGGLAGIGAVVSSAPVIIIMTSRIEGDPLTPAWRSQTGGAPVTTIDLGPMANYEITALAEALGAKDAKVVRSCIERAGGHPLFLEQLLRHLSDSDAKTDVPASVQSIAQVRLDHLDAPARITVQAASILGQRFAIDSVEHLLNGQPANLAQPIAQGLIRHEGGTYIFAHALLCDAIYDTLLAKRRKQLHSRAADWFAERDLTLRAEHLERAGDNNAPEAFRLAAKQHLSAYRYVRAERLAVRGMELAPNPGDRAALTILLGDILHDQGAMRKAVETYESALKIAGDDLQRCQAYIGLALVKRITDDLDGAWSDIGAAEKLAERSGNSRDALTEQARVHFLRGNLLFPRGEAKRCLEAHEKSLALARSAQHPEFEAAALGGIGDAQYLAGRMRSAYETLSACVEICRKGGHGRIEVANLAQLGCAVTHFWPQEDALAALEDARASAARVGHQRAEINALAGQLWALRDLGAFERCVDVALDTRSLIRTLGATRYDQMALMGLGVSLIKLGDLKNGLARLREGTEIAERTGPGFHGAELYACLASFTDDREESFQALARMEAILGAACVGHSPLRAYPFAVGAALGWGEVERAQRYIRLLETFTRPEPLSFTEFYIRFWQAAIAAREPASSRKTSAGRDELKQMAAQLHLHEAASQIDQLFEAD